MAAGLFKIDRFLGKANQIDPVSSSMVPGSPEHEYRKGVFQTSLVNYDVTNDNKLKVRKGTVRAVAGDAHSLSPDAPGYFVLGSNLCKMESVDLNTESITHSIIAPVTPGKQHRMYFCQVAERLFYSNGIDSGVVLPGGVVRPWGIENPANLPSPVAGGGGSLAQGTYSLTYTYESNDGRESGSNGDVQVYVPSDGGSITISSLGISSDPTVVRKNIYISTPNGTQEYFYTSIDNAATSHVILGDFPLKHPMATMFKAPPPKGGPIVHYKGRIYVVSGQHILISDPMSYELFGESFISMETTISMLRPVNDGIFVGDERGVHFMGGSGPEDFKLTNVLNYRAVPFSDVNIEESSEAVSARFMFCTERGVCVAGDGGSVKNVTYKTYHFPSSQWSAAMLRLDENVHQYVIVLHEPGAVENKYSGPQIPKTVINNFV